MDFSDSALSNTAMGKIRVEHVQLDRVRRTIRDRIADLPGATFKAASRLMHRNEAYLHQFVYRGSPAKLGEDDRRILAQYLGLPESDLRLSKSFSEPGLGYGDDPVPISPPAPMAPYEASDLMGDLIESLDRLHHEEKMPLNLRELGCAAWDMHEDILSTDTELRKALVSAINARRRWLRKERPAILAAQRRGPPSPPKLVE